MVRRAAPAVGQEGRERSHGQKQAEMGAGAQLFFHFSLSSL